MRLAFRMTVNRDKIAEYERRHNPIWKDLEAALISHGVRNYSIFIDETDCSLFGYAEVDSRKKWDSIAETEVNKRWWKHMKDIMPSNVDNSPVSKELREVFHIQK